MAPELGIFKNAGSRVRRDSSEVYHGCGEMYVCSGILVGFVCSHGDAFEFFELAEEIPDPMGSGEETRRGCCGRPILPPRSLRFGYQAFVGDEPLKGAQTLGHPVQFLAGSFHTTTLRYRCHVA